MDTHHHTVSLRVKSVLDSCGGADELTGRDDDLQELEASQQVSTHAYNRDVPIWLHLMQRFCLCLDHFT